MNQIKCCECDTIIEETAALRAPNPFDPSEELVGCPTCKSVDSFLAVCDEPDCVQTVSCGWQSPEGYRRTCYQHSHWNKDEK